MDREGISGVDRYTTFGYDEAGAVLSIADTSRDGTDNQCFTHDALQRLTEAWAQNTTGCAATPSASVLGGPAPYWQSWTYGTTGNRATETDHNPSGNLAQDVKQTYTYPAPKAAQPHTLTKLDTTGPNGATAQSSYVYDAGNTSTRTVGGNEQDLTWDAEGHLTSVAPPAGHTGTTTSYLYDADGNRLIQRTDTATTLYLGGAEITLGRAGNPPTTPTATRYYDLGNGTQAVRSNDNKVSFVIPDHQATGELAIDAGTSAMQQRRTTPFGGLRGIQPTTWPGTKGFVGGTNDPTTGLTHLGAREYDPTIGRFISADPVLAPGSPQQMNGYAYSGNNPVTSSDPTGLCPRDLCGDGYLIGGDGSRGYTGQRADDTPCTSCNMRLGSTGATAGQKEAAKRDQDWIDKVTPKSTKVNQLVAWWDGFSGINTTGDYWMPTIDDFTLCFGLLGCKKAHDYLLDNPDDVEGAKEIAANYCIDNLPDCKHDARGHALSNSLAHLVQDLILAREGLKGRGPCSFDSSTPVLLENGKTKPIGKVKPGDQVEAADPNTGQHRGPRAVTASHINHDDDLIDLTIQTGQGLTSVVHTTSRHPFWDDTLHTWVAAGQLTPGHDLNTATDQHVRIVAVHGIPGAADMYNLTVNELHTYYVLAGNTPVLVHNDNGGGLPGAEEARLQVMRMAGIPLDATPIDTLRNASGVQYVYDLDGRYMLVTENTMDRSHPGQPHWEAGPAKPGLQVDNYGRYRVSNDKVKVNFSYGGC